MFTELITNNIKNALIHDDTKYFCCYFFICCVNIDYEMRKNLIK